MRTVLHEVAGNRLKPNSVTIPFSKILTHDRVTFSKDRVTAVDFAAKVVQTTNGEQAYDYLIMGLGSTPNYLGVPGAEEYSYPLWTYHDALRIRKHVRECFAQAQLCQDSAKRRELLTFAVIGSGATGVEMIGELARWLPELCASHRINRQSVRLLLCDRSPRVLKTLCETNSQRAHDYLSGKMGVEIRLGVTVEAVHADGLVVSGETIPHRPSFGQLVSVPAIWSSRWISKSASPAAWLSMRTARLPIPASMWWGISPGSPSLTASSIPRWQRMPSTPAKASPKISWLL